MNGTAQHSVSGGRRPVAGGRWPVACWGWAVAGVQYGRAELRGGAVLAWGDARGYGEAIATHRADGRSGSAGPFGGWLFLCHRLSPSSASRHWGLYSVVPYPGLGVSRCRGKESPPPRYRGLGFVLLPQPHSSARSALRERAALWALIRHALRAFACCRLAHEKVTGRYREDLCRLPFGHARGLRLGRGCP